MDKQTARDALIAKVHKEITQYENEQYWITDKVAFNMREMIKTFRKNYYGIYDDPVDPKTKKEKLWVPLTRLLVDAVRKNVDLDPKDTRFRATWDGGRHLTHLIRGYMRRWFSQIYFNAKLNESIFVAARDGTDVWKTYTVDGKIKTKSVDLLNIYIDPTADSIQDTYRFTERVLMTQNEVQGMDWENTSEFVTQKDLEKTGGETAVKKAGEFGDVYECWGKFPRKEVYAAMGLEHSDEDDEIIEAQVVVSGFDTGTAVFHLAEENTTKDKNGDIVKPYEEFWYVKSPGRWYGIGIVETVLQLQWWINQTVNLRINKNTVAQLGLLKIRKGSKVTQQMLNNLVSKGVIQLTNMDDVDQMRIDEAGQSSYTDEESAKQWAQEVTAVFDINLGELPASTTATGAAIQDRQSRSAYTLVVESAEYFIQRWIDRQVLPKIPAQIKKEGKTTFYRDFDDVKQVRERLAAKLVADELEKATVVPSMEEIEAEMQRVERVLQERGDLTFDMVEEIIAKGYDTEVFMTNAEMDIGVTVRNLLELRNGVDPEAAREMTAEALDLLGLKVPQSLQRPSPIQQQQAAPAQQTPTNLQEIVTEANTLNSEQV